MKQTTIAVVMLMILTGCEEKPKTETIDDVSIVPFGGRAVLGTIAPDTVHIHDTLYIHDTIYTEHVTNTVINNPNTPTHIGVEPN